MRRIDDTPLDPEIAAQLDAIDATLAGEPVDPQYAELAELALLLTADRPAADPEFVLALDQRVARRFADSGGSGSAEAGPGSARWWALGGRDWLAPLAGLATGCVAVVVAVVVLGSGGGASSSSSTAAAEKAPTATSASSSPSSTSSSASSSRAPSRRAARTATPLSKPAPGTASGAAAGALSAVATSASGLSTGGPQPTGNGRKIVQSAQLALGTPADHIDDVAQEVFDVAGREHAVVENSNVTAGSAGSAQFQLSVPSAALGATMGALSHLRYANVTSRTDATQDVNGQYLSDTRKLGDDRALRTSLLKQLASATTQEQLDSLKARIRDAEASIRSDESTLRGINHRVDFSQVTVTIDGAGVPVRPPRSSGHSGSSFTLGKAAHDAGRVLTVVAGVALITLAALAPVALIGALAWWIASGVRRRRREQALDLA